MNDNINQDIIQDGTLAPQPEALPQEQTVDVVTKMATATAMALGTSFCMERKMLAQYGDSHSVFSIKKRINGETKSKFFKWIKIEQIGRADSDNLAGCFAALKNILRACSIPKAKLLFLITGQDRQFSLYMGLKFDEDYNIDLAANAIKEINGFATSSWKGLKTKVIDKSKQDPDLEAFISNQYDKAYAVTGIPSMDLDKTGYPSTLEYLLGGCKPKGKIAYLVVADPISETEVDSMLYQCEEIGGQAESFKSFNVSESLQKGFSDSVTHTVSETIGRSKTDGTSTRDVKSALKMLIGVGATIGAAASFGPLAGLFPAIGGALTAAAPTVASQLVVGGSLTATGILASFIPQKSSSVTMNRQETESDSTTHGTSTSYSATLGRTVVNGHADTIAEQMKAHKQRFLAGKAKGMWQVGCYLFTDNENATSHMQLRSILSGDSSQLEPIRVHNISEFVTDESNNKVAPFIAPPELYINMDVEKDSGDIFRHPLGMRNSYLTTVLTTDELTSMINFPLHSVPGISVVEDTPEFRLDVPEIQARSDGKKDENAKNITANIGYLIDHGTETKIGLSMDIDSLTRHCLICGANGSGKTNTVLGILNELALKQKNFMVIEPAKTEYVDWAIGYNERLAADQKEGRRTGEQPIVIYMPGKKSYWHAGENDESTKYELKDILKLNPFEPVVLDGQEPNVMAHIDRIKSIFALAFPMEDILPTVMDALIRDVYTYGENWLRHKDGTPWPEHYPTLALLACRIRPVIASLGYEPRVTSNIFAAINLRINNLLSGWKRTLLNNEVLGGYKKLSRTEEKLGIKRPTWDDFFGRMVVVNLSGVADDNDRSFVMGLLLLYLYEYRIATSERQGFSFNSNKLRHLMVVEEAHRVMMSNPNPDSPQYKCGQLFSNLLSEIRAYGQGMMIVDQVPSRLIADAVKNTNLKIIHRLISADDVEMVAKSMGVSDEQQKIIPKLQTGQAVIAGLHTGQNSAGSVEDIYWCKINKTKNN